MAHVAKKRAEDRKRMEALRAKAGAAGISSMLLWLTQSQKQSLLRFIGQHQWQVLSLRVALANSTPQASAAPIAAATPVTPATESPSDAQKPKCDKSWRYHTAGQHELGFGETA